MTEFIDFLHFATSDGLLVVFFFLLGLELIEELKHGDLRDPKTAAVPAISAIGGVIAPIGIFFIGVHLFNVTDFSNGWAIPTATDVAFSLAVLSIFGKHIRSSIKLFVLVLAVVDDVIGIFIIAFMAVNNIGGLELLGVLICLIIWRVILSDNKIQIKNRILRNILLGLTAICCWYFTWKSGIHPTISGVLLGVLVPTTGKNHSKSPAKAMIKVLTPLCNRIVVPIFAVVSLFASGYHLVLAFGANAAETHDTSQYIALSGVITVALLIGKPLGILSFCWVSEHLVKPLQLFHGLKVRYLIGASVFCGVGFTVSILISTISYSDHILIAFSQIGIIIGSGLAVAVGIPIQILLNKKYKH